jgi:hypothetical protein
MNLSDGEVDVDMEFPWSDMGYSGENRDGVFSYLALYLVIYLAFSEGEEATSCARKNYSVITS